MATKDDLLRAAEEIGEAIKQHARALAESPDDTKAVTDAGNRLRTAAVTYVENALDLTGWAQPFSNLEDELRDESEEESAGDTEGEEEAAPSVVKVDASYLVRVNDVEAARRVLAERGAAQEFS